MHSKKSRKSLTPQVRHVLRVILASYLIVWCVVAFTLHNAINRYSHDANMYRYTQETARSVYNVLQQPQIRHAASIPSQSSVQEPPQWMNCKVDALYGCNDEPPIIGIPLVTIMIADYIKLDKSITHLEQQTEVSIDYIDSLATEFDSAFNNYNMQLH